MLDIAFLIAEKGNGRKIKKVTMQELLTTAMQVKLTTITIQALENVTGVMRQLISLNTVQSLNRKFFSEGGHTDCSGIKTPLQIQT